jgi:uncharacterized protein (UPF0264 family)
MTGMLASVNSLDEALLVLQAGVDIIDLKQPQYGALGALDIATVRSIVNRIKKTCPISATVGDLPMQADIVFNAVEAMAKTGVDYIKIGFFPDGNHAATINKLTEFTHQGQYLIAVLFADTQPDFSLLNTLKQAGFHGVMLDTQNKKLGSLTSIMSLAKITAFILQARQLKLLSGLAGSLRKSDIPRLLPLQADYLGFRGALCQQHKRTATLDYKAVEQIKATLLSNNTPIIADFSGLRKQH